mgnify:CR=1 FL=1
MKTLIQLKVLALIAIILGLWGIVDSVYIAEYNGHQIVRVFWDSVFFIILQLVCAWAILSFRPSGFREIPFVGVIFISSLFILFSVTMLISGLDTWKDDTQGAVYLAGSLIFYCLVIYLSFKYKRQLKGSIKVKGGSLS